MSEPRRPRTGGQACWRQRQVKSKAKKGATSVSRLMLSLESNSFTAYLSACKNWMKRGTTLVSITCWMGGFFSIESRRRNCVVNSVWACGLSDMTPATICGRFSRVWGPTGVGCAGMACWLDIWDEAPGFIDRLLLSLSSFFVFLIEMVVSSRRRRESSASKFFLKSFFRLWGREEGPRVGSVEHELVGTCVMCGYGGVGFRFPAPYEIRVWLYCIEENNAEALG